jgi:hypothetical protein
MTTTGKPDALFLLLDERNGIHIPRCFVQDFDLNAYDGVSPQDAITCTDPDNEGYWDAWTSILDSATLTTTEGYKYRLHQDGDLWLCCEELMDDEEYHNFFGVAREIDPEPEYDPTPGAKHRTYTFEITKTIQVVIEADSLRAACRRAIDDDEWEESFAATASNAVLINHTEE